jgi:hypothetical protein
VAGAVVQLAGCAALLLLDSSTPVCVLVLLGTVIGIPQGLIAYATGIRSAWTATSLATCMISGVPAVYASGAGIRVCHTSG